MTEKNKFKLVDSIGLYDDSIGKVSLYDASHANESEEQRIWTVSTLAGIAYGNEEAKNPESLYKRLQELKHESLWEFVRIGQPIGASKPTISESMRYYPKSYPLTPTMDGFESNHKQNIACFRIKVPIFVARQFMRHRSFSYIEMSRRYTKDSKVPFQFWFPKGYDDIDKQQDKLSFYGDYEHTISRGYHTQVASRFLPQTTYTEFYMMGEAEGLKNFFKLRLDSHAQAEIRELAEGMIELLKQYQPELYTKVNNESN